MMIKAVHKNVLSIYLTVPEVRSTGFKERQFMLVAGLSLLVLTVCCLWNCMYRNSSCVSLSSGCILHMVKTTLCRFICMKD